MKKRAGRASVPPIFWGVVLWIVVPALLFLAGYKVVGPRIGEVPRLKEQAEKVEDLLANKAPASGVPMTQSDPDTQVSDKTGPDIEVTVEKSGKKVEREKPKRRKKKSTRSAPAEPTRSRDEASGDGAMGGGGDGPADPAGGQG